MKYIINQLLKERKQLEKCIKNTKIRLKNIPEGHLRISNKGNHVEYYLKHERKKEQDDNSKNCKKNGRYIKKKDEKIAKRIAQRDYDMSLLKKAEERVKAIDVFLKKYEKTNIYKVYEKMNVYRRRLLHDAILSDEEYIKMWESVEYEGKLFPEGTPEIFTDRGERVRSKSEKIIADKLNMLGIPYRYEYPLDLDDYVKIYPDFTILNIDTREEVYLEHCGLMDNPEYVENLIFKLKTYEKNSIFLGVNLFITYENARYPLDGKTIDALVKNLFCCTKSNVLLK